MKILSAPRRAVNRFLQDPASIRTAVWLIIGSTIAAVVLGGILMRLLDAEEYPTLGRAVWFTLQTVTTVGYGDVTPTRVVGRVIGGAVMLTGIGFITVVTAAVTSVFVEASRQRASKAADSHNADVPTVNARLEQMEQMLALLLEQTRER
jgi:voltage-gated potassium channel